MTSIFKVGDKTIRPGRGWTDADGIQHPGNWNLWSADEKSAKGITEIVMQPLPRNDLYDASHNADGSVNSTAKPLDDLPVVGVQGEPVMDTGGKQMVRPGVRPVLRAKVKAQQASHLAQTDWAIVREADVSTAVPANIKTWRDAIRAKATAMEEAIDGAADMAAIEALFVAHTRNADGSVTKSGILYDWPELD